jgi:nucleotide-binding universal stress UspA family protein
VLVHAYRVPLELEELSDQMATSKGYLDGIRGRLAKAAAELLESYRSQLDGSGLTVDVLATEGRPGSEIIKALESQDCDCAVLGQRGRGRIKRLLLGSVSDYVLHHAKRPVLLVP